LVAFSLTLNTAAFVRSTLRWFETSACTAVPAGPPPSSVQHCCIQAAYAACPRIRGAQSSAYRIVNGKVKMQVYGN